MICVSRESRRTGRQDMRQQRRYGRVSTGETYIRDGRNGIAHKENGSVWTVWDGGRLPKRLFHRDDRRGSHYGNVVPHPPAPFSRLERAVLFIRSNQKMNRRRWPNTNSKWLSRIRLNGPDLHF